MLNAAVRCALALVLAVAAGMKLYGARSSQAALGTFGLRSPVLRWAVWGGLVAAELGLAAGVALGSSIAAYAASALLIAFAAVLAVALARRRGGAPCACFGSRSRVTRTALARNLGLAAAFAVTPLLPGHEPTVEQWLALGLGAALIGVAALGVAVLALAREVGMLRLQIAPQSALEIPDEGPPLGVGTNLIERFDPGPGAELALAVFSSEGCHVCRALEPALATFEREPLVDLRVFEEQRDLDVWRALEIPGSPYAVALDLGGVVLAKGTFNTLGQLESVLGSAERRAREPAHA